MEEDKMSIKREDILKLLSVSSKRYIHILGTEKAAIELARIHHPNLDLYSVSTAALLHDLTKEYTFEEHLTVAERYNVVLEEKYISVPKLLHANTASLICRYELKLSDEICDAVFYHTTGKPCMSALEEIIYFADYIEENRTDDECVSLRNSYFELLEKHEPRLALDKALVLSFNRTINNLLRKDQIIDHNIIDARNYYLNKSLNV